MPIVRGGPTRSTVILKTSYQTTSEQHGREVMTCYIFGATAIPMYFSIGSSAPALAASSGIKCKNDIVSVIVVVIVSVTGGQCKVLGSNNHVHQQRR